jgi:hypothetical protein
LYSGVSAHMGGVLYRSFGSRNGMGGAISSSTFVRRLGVRVRAPAT